MDTNLILEEVKKKLPKGKMGNAALAEIKNRLDSLSDKGRSDAFLKIQEANLKTPIIVDIFNFCFGTLGVGRFMIGDIGIGIARLALLLIWCAVSSLNDGSEEMKVIDITFGVFVWGWWLVDLVLVLKKVRMQNLRKVLLAIDSVKSK